MTTQVPTRFADPELEALDELVAHGVAGSRSELIRMAVARVVDEHRRQRVGQRIVAAYTDQPQTTDDDELAVAAAIALTEAEPW